MATANVLQTLGRPDAFATVAAVLERRPDVVGLQEWYPSRFGLGRHFEDYEWFLPLLGGCAVGSRRDRFVRLSRRSRLLSPPGRADRDGRRWGLEPPRLASVVIHRDLESGGTVALVDYHLVSQVQVADRYRDDRPELVARHRRETGALHRLVEEVRGAGHTTYACGDSNFHGFAIPGLVSAWAGRADGVGTLGPHRQVDDIFAALRPQHVALTTTPSDHRAVVATFETDRP